MIYSIGLILSLVDLAYKFVKDGMLNEMRFYVRPYELSGLASLRPTRDRFWTTVSSWFIYLVLWPWIDTRETACLVQLNLLDSPCKHNMLP